MRMEHDVQNELTPSPWGYPKHWLGRTKWKSTVPEYNNFKHCSDCETTIIRITRFHKSRQVLAEHTDATCGEDYETNQFSHKCNNLILQDTCYLFKLPINRLQQWPPILLPCDTKLTLCWRLLVSLLKTEICENNKSLFNLDKSRFIWFLLHPKFKRSCGLWFITYDSTFERDTFMFRWLTRLILHVC